MDIIRAMMEQKRLINKLNLMHKKRKSAHSTGAQTCQNSGVCCWQRPGALTKEDLKRLADHHNISQTSFAQKYCMSDIIGSTRLLILRRQHQEGGQFISQHESFSIESPCVFLDDKKHKCKVHDIKPEQCVKMKCWEKDDDDLKYLEWTSEDIEQLGLPLDEDYYDYDDDYDDDW